MKFATMRNGEADGLLAVVSRDLSAAAPADGICTTLQEAIEHWPDVQDALGELASQVEAGDAEGLAPFRPDAALAPLPRAWQWLDGSAYESHAELMQQVFGLDPTPKDRPLMYQGISDTFYSATQDVPFPSEDDFIDFEGEYGVIVDRVPLGCSAAEAEAHIRLLVQINDWSLRKLAPIEMRTGFGWVQAKPPCSVAPVAVTLDELGPFWRDGRVDLPLLVDLNGARFGAPQGYPMAWSFPQLIAHAARTRALVAGTLLGSGTVSNADFRTVGSSCIAEQRGIETADLGEARTPYLRFGDRVRMEVLLPGGGSVFGAIDQRVVST